METLGPQDHLENLVNKAFAAQKENWDLQGTEDDMERREKAVLLVLLVRSAYGETWACQAN